MSIVESIAEAARSTGYRREAVLRDYAFADVLDPAATTRRVALAAFTQTPPSYRSAAFGVVTDDTRDPYVPNSCRKCDIRDPRFPIAISIYQ